MALKNTKPETLPSNVIRLLSTVAVINNAAFDNLTLMKRTTVTRLQVELVAKKFGWEPTISA